MRSLPPGPAVPHIARKGDQGRWVNGNDRDWTASVTWDVHGNDIAAIDAQTHSVSCIRGLMTIVSGIGLTLGGDAVAVGIESSNDLRFEQNANGVLVKCVAATVPPGAASGTAVDINPHLNYPSQTSTRRT